MTVNLFECDLKQFTRFQVEIFHRKIKWSHRNETDGAMAINKFRRKSLATNVAMQQALIYALWSINKLHLLPQTQNYQTENVFESPKV